MKFNEEKSRSFHHSYFCQEQCNTADSTILVSSSKTCLASRNLRFKLADMSENLKILKMRQIDAESRHCRDVMFICSTSVPGGNQVDGLPPASSVASVTSARRVMTRRADKVDRS